MDWSNISHLLQQYITRKPKAIDLQVVCCFDDDRVKIGLQASRKFNLPFLLQLSLFGDNNKKLYDYELAKQTKQCIVIYISLMARIQELLTVSEERTCRLLVIAGKLTLSMEVKIYWDILLTKIGGT